MGLTVTPLEPEGLSDVKLLSQMCGKMNLPPSRFSSALWALMYIASFMLLTKAKFAVKSIRSAVKAMKNNSVAKFILVKLKEH